MLAHAALDMRQNQGFVQEQIGGGEQFAAVGRDHAVADVADFAARIIRTA